MIATVARAFARLSLFTAVLGFCALTSLNAYGAATPEGCDQKVQKAQESKATTRTAYDVDVTETTEDKPDSTLATTCFNDLAGIDADGGASGGGGIFSGDFKTQSPSGSPGGLSADISDALTNFYNDYIDADGYDSGLVDYSGAATTLVNTATCNETQDLWTEVKQEGPQDGVPYATITDLINGSIPQGAGNDYTKNWNTEQGVDNNFTTLSTDLAAQPQENTPTYNPTFGQTQTFCQDLITAGVPGAACP